MTVQYRIHKSLLSYPSSGVTYKDVDSDWNWIYSLAHNHNKLQKVFHNYHCQDYSQDTLNLHRSGAGLPSNLPASAAEARSLQLTLIRSLEMELLNSNSFKADSKYRNFELRNLSSYGRTAKEIPIFKISCFSGLCFAADMCFNKSVTSEVPYSLSQEL
jgi:hypothetical protein